MSKHEYAWGGHCECSHSAGSHGLPGPGGIVYGERCYFGGKDDRCPCLVYKKCYCLEKYCSEKCFMSSTCPHKEGIVRKKDILETERRSERW